MSKTARKISSAMEPPERSEEEELAAAEAWLDNLDPATTTARDARHLRAVGQALTALEAAEEALQKAIDDARDAGESWGSLGMVLGTSRQNAHRKYGPHRTQP